MDEYVRRNFTTSVVEIAEIAKICGEADAEFILMTLATALKENNVAALADFVQVWSEPCDCGGNHNDY